MCGRFGSSFDGRDLAERYELANEIDFSPRYNIAPSYNVPTVTRNSPNKTYLMKWGFMPHWADPLKFKLRPPNARADQVSSNAMYRDAFKKTRCIIPASFFYEWKRITIDGEEQKIPYLIKLKDTDIFSFAGIYSEKKDAEGRPVYTFAIITTEPNELMKDIHSRMPVILKKEDETKWMDVETDIEEIKSLLVAYDSDLMEAYRVSSRVNSPRNDDPSLVDPVSPESHTQ